MEIVLLTRTFISDMFFGKPYVQVTDYWDLFIVNFSVVLVALLTAYVIFQLFSLIYHLIGG